MFIYEFSVPVEIDIFDLFNFHNFTCGINLSFLPQAMKASIVFSIYSVVCALETTHRILAIFFGTTGYGMA